MKSDIFRVPVIVHTNSILSNCDSCDSFDSKSDSESSSSSGDSPIGPRFTCKWSACGLGFDHVDDLASHVTLLHANSGPGGLFFCGWEGCARGERGFNARYKMLVHVRTHTNEKPHHCYQCEKSFSRAENLKIHARSHTGEKPYACPIPGCGKAYSNSSDRFKHTRTHLVDKPYTCKVPGCGKRYTDPSSLRKHVKTYRHIVSKPVDDKMEEEETKSNEFYTTEEPTLVTPTMCFRNEEINCGSVFYHPSVEEPSPATPALFLHTENKSTCGMFYNPANEPAPQESAVYYHMEDTSKGLFYPADDLSRFDLFRNWLRPDAWQNTSYWHAPYIIDRYQQDVPLDLSLHKQ